MVCFVIGLPPPPLSYPILPLLLLLLYDKERRRAVPKNFQLTESLDIEISTEYKIQTAHFEKSHPEGIQQSNQLLLHEVSNHDGRSGLRSLQLMTFVLTQYWCNMSKPVSQCLGIRSKKTSLKLTKIQKTKMANEMGSSKCCCVLE